jgi:protein O-GlcNAcase/histone acetyltransferase
MASPETTRFLSGVIEGFYGPPWAQSERLELFDWMAAWGLNTYFYCPKDDWKQRAIWRESYSDAEADILREMIRACSSRGLHFIYALSPGLDIRYSSEADLDHLRQRFEQMLGLGCTHFALLFDDIPDRLDPADVSRWGSLAAAQAHVANTLLDWTLQRSPGARFLFCPTPYCGRMAAAKLGGPDYLPTLGTHLAPGIDILWTGPEIISREITVEHVRELAAILRRKPLIWDNLHANDYDGRRFFCGPYSGRPREILSEVAGVLTNPNCEFQLNYVAFRTLAAFIRDPGPWNPRAAYLDALREWHAHFATCGSNPIAFDDLVLLGDCYYLPYEDGPEAGRLFAGIDALLASDPTGWGDRAAEFRTIALRLRDVCARIAELRRRPLFYALGRRVWELREEMDLLERYVSLRAANPDPACRIGSDFHLPGTYRGGFVARLQSLLRQTAAGDFTPTHLPSSPP